MDTEFINELKISFSKEDYVSVINGVRKAVQEDRRAFAHPFIKEWCGKRFRNIFLSEAVKDDDALKAATENGLFRKKDIRDDRQKISERFLKGDEIREWFIDMPEVEAPESFNTTLVFCPGLLTGMLPVRAFQTPFPIVSKKLNIRILRADAHPMRSSAANVPDLLNAVERGLGFTADLKQIPEQEAVPPGDIFLMGYSKGAPDIMTMLMARPDLKDRIRCIINWGGAVGGSPLADNIYLSIKDMELPLVEKTIENYLLRLFPIINEKGLLRRFEEFNIKEAIYDLTTMCREKYVTEHRDALDALDIPFFNVTGSTSMMKAPYFQVQGVLELNKYDSNNDMQLTQAAAKLTIPMSTNLAILNAHHWDMSYDPFPLLMRFGSPNLDHPFPREAAAAALILLSAELGLID